MCSDRADRTVRPHAATAEAAGNRLVGAVLREPPGFVPRADLQAKLDRPGRHAVTGIQGAGTTQLAAEYARARLAAGWRMVAWVNAESTGTLLAGLAAVADAAGLSEGAARQDAGDPGLLVRRRLETDGDRCLLVFDDVQDPEVLRPFLPVGGAARVLITSHRESDFEPNVPVHVFSEDQALMFLAYQTGLADKAAAATVAAQLGYLPLALAQAAAFITRQHLGYQTYLDRLRALPAEDYLEEPYSHGTAQAVLLSLGTIRAGDQAGICTTLMGIMAVLSPAGVRRDLLHAAGKAGVLASGGRPVAADLVDRALEQLAGFSLLSFSLDGQTIVVHRLVSQVVREGMARGERLTVVFRRAASLLEARAQALAGSRDRPAIRDIPGQVAALAEMARPVARVDEELARVLLRLRFFALYHLIEAQRQRGAGRRGRRAADRGPCADARPEPSGHPELAEQPGRRLPGRGSARRRDPDVRADGRQAGNGSCAGHPDTITSRNNLAAAWEQAGLTTRSRCRADPGHPGASAWRRPPEHLELAEQPLRAYREAGRAAEAIPLVEQTLAACERLLGADHPGPSAPGMTSPAPTGTSGGSMRRSCCSSRLWPAGNVSWAPIIPHRDHAEQPRPRLPGHEPRVLSTAVTFPERSGRSVWFAIDRLPITPSGLSELMHQEQTA